MIVPDSAARQKGSLHEALLFATGVGIWPVCGTSLVTSVDLFANLFGYSSGGGSGSRGLTYSAPLILAICAMSFAALLGLACAADAWAHREDRPSRPVQKVWGIALLRA